MTVRDHPPAPATTGDLGRIVGDVDALRAAWETDPLRSSGLGDFSDVFGLELADDLVTGRGLKVPYLRLVRDGQYVPPSRWTHRTGTAGGVSDGVANPPAVLREFRDGATIVLRGMVRYCPPLAAFCAGLTRELGFDVSAGAYLTPPGSRGAGPHYDPMSVIVRQVHGVKHWRVQAPPTRWPRTLPGPGERYDSPAIAEFSLRPGESLYLPRGFVHDAWTTDEPSVHVTFSGDTPVTWTDVLLDRVREIADADESLRAALQWPSGDDPDALRAEADAVLRRLVTALTSTDPGALAADLIARHRSDDEPNPAGSLAAVLR